MVFEWWCAAGGRLPRHGRMVRTAYFWAGQHVATSCVALSQPSGVRRVVLGLWCTPLTRSSLDAFIWLRSTHGPEYRDAAAGGMR